MNTSIKRNALALLSVGAMSLVGQAQAWYDSSRFDGTYMVKCNNYVDQYNENLAPTATDSYIELTSFKLSSDVPGGSATDIDLSKDPDFPTRLYLECEQDNSLTINSGSRNIIANFVKEKCKEYNETFAEVLNSIPGFSVTTGGDGSEAVCANATGKFMENIDNAIHMVSTNQIWRPVTMFDVTWDTEDVGYFFGIRFSSPFTDGNHVNYGGGTMWTDRRPMNMALQSGPTQALSVATKQEFLGVPGCGGNVRTTDNRIYQQISQVESVSSPDFNKIDLYGNAVKTWSMSCSNQHAQFGMGFKIHHGYHGKNY